MTTGSTATDLDQAFEFARALDGPLNARLRSYADDLRRLNAPFAEAVDHLVERLEATEAGAGAPKVGELLPPFLLPDERGRLTSLEDIVGNGPAAIVFQRGHWCPYCRLTNAALAAFERARPGDGARIAVITPDRKAYTLLMKRETGAGYPILTDIDNGYALSLGLAIWVGDEMRAQMQSIGRDLGSSQGNDSWLLPIPAVFVVGRDGRVMARHVDPDYRRRMEIDDLVAALQAVPAQDE
jgi:peroxiredoxin